MDLTRYSFFDELVVLLLVVCSVHFSLPFFCIVLPSFCIAFALIAFLLVCMLQAASGRRDALAEVDFKAV